MELSEHQNSRQTCRNIHSQTHSRRQLGNVQYIVSSVIPGMVFLVEYETVVDFTSRVIAFRTLGTAVDMCCTRINADKHTEMDIAAMTSQHISLPPLLPIMLTATCSTEPNGHSLTEGSMQLLLEHGIGITGGIVLVKKTERVMNLHRRHTISQGTRR